jgi:hypothetical protein
MSESQDRQTEDLPVTLRWLCGSAGLMLVICSGLIFMRPPLRQTSELNGVGIRQKTVESHAEVNNVCIVVFLAGVIVFVFGVNGRIVTRVAAGDYSAESNPTKQAETVLADTTAEHQQVDLPDDVSPTPTEAESGVTSGDLAVYKLADVPTKVISDAISKWPNGDVPADLGTFEFAARKKGKGNHPWNLKFRGHPLIVVTYGGQAKSAATVASKPG